MLRCPEDRGVLGTRGPRFLPLHLTLGAGFGESLLSFISALRNNTLLRNVASFSYPLPPFSFFLAELEKCIQEQERLAQLFIKHVSVSLHLTLSPPTRLIYVHFKIPSLLCSSFSSFSELLLFNFLGSLDDGLLLLHLFFYP